MCTNKNMVYHKALTPMHELPKYDDFRKVTVIM